VDSYLTLFSLLSTSGWLSHNRPQLIQLWGDVPASSLRGLGGLDYRKYLTADMVLGGAGLFADKELLGLSGLKRVIDKIYFSKPQIRSLQGFQS
jgi:hypothetical protein